ncbi:MAG: AAA ATPase [Phylliscum demangeonii]|nr:MAG: AAA ATPase [Phylliscum demangeonii]
MVSSALGKRTRSSAKATPSHGRLGRPRPSRAEIGIGNEENDNPFLSRKRTRRHLDGEEEEEEEWKALDEGARDDEKDNDFDSMLVTATASASASASVAAAARIALSPAKVNGPAKSVVSSPAGKQRQTIQVVTPQTPRFRDALAKKAVPSTPRHRVSVVGKPLTPRTPRTPRTPTTPSQAALTTVYHSARQLFVRSAHPGRLVGREAERAELTRFLHDRMAARTGGCLYVSGPPGTGKSALVNEVCRELAERQTAAVAHINCMSLRTTKDLLAKLVDELSGHRATTTTTAAPAVDDTDHDKDADADEDDETAVLQKMFVTRQQAQPVYLVTLDEIDHLLQLDLEIVYTLFGWSLQKRSRLVLIGIANALDFTDRFLPRLKARQLKPQLLPFLPYAAPQITSVIASRLRSLLPPDTSAAPDFLPILHPAAAQLCARKVAGQTGDLRKAFDICRRAIELVEGETTQKLAARPAHEPLSPPTSPSRGGWPLKDNINLSSSSPMRTPMKTGAAAKPSSRPEALQRLTAETAPRATIAHVARVTSTAFGHGTSQRLQTLNLQQKAVLCALVGVEKQKRALASVLATPSKTDRAAPTVRALYQMYSARCRRDGMLHPLTSTEFRDVVASLETLSLVCAVDGTHGSLAPIGSTPRKRGRGAAGFGPLSADDRRVGSCVGEKELEAAVEGVAGGILRALLHDVDV